MLWVTITMVYLSFSWRINSSIFWVAMGSRADAGFIHEDHLRLDGQCPSDAEALLLPAGKSQRRVMDPVLNFIPKGRLSQTLFHALCNDHFILDAVNMQTIRHIIKDGLRKGIRFLKHHADTPTDLNDIYRWCIDVPSIEEHFSLYPSDGDKVIHPIETAQQCALAASRWSDQGGDAVRRKVEGNVMKRPRRAIIETQAPRRHPN